MIQKPYDFECKGAKYFPKNVVIISVILFLLLAVRDHDDKIHRFEYLHE